MAAREPGDIHRLFAESFRAGDLDGLMRLYEPDAVSQPRSGDLIRGKKAIRGAFERFLAMKGKFDLQPRRVIASNDVALLISKWMLAGTGPDGAPVTVAGEATDVARRQPDGTWLLAIDNPYGVA